MKALEAELAESKTSLAKLTEESAGTQVTAHCLQRAAPMAPSCSKKLCACSAGGAGHQAHGAD